MEPDHKLAGSDSIVFTQLYETYYKRVYQFMRYRCQCIQTAEDLTILVFERILNHLQRYQPGEAPIEAWVFTIATNCFNDWYRKKKIRSWLPWEFFNHQPSRNPSPEDQIIQSENHRQLQIALAQLPNRDKELIAWRFGARLNNRQIAEITHLSEQNVAVILFRALRKLKQNLDAQQEVDYV